MLNKGIKVACITIPRRFETRPDSSPHSLFQYPVPSYVIATPTTSATPALHRHAIPISIPLLAPAVNSGSPGPVCVGACDGTGCCVDRVPGDPGSIATLRDDRLGAAVVSDVFVEEGGGGKETVAVLLTLALMFQLVLLCSRGEWYVAFVPLRQGK